MTSELNATTITAISQRVREIGERISEQGLSALTCQHAWVTWRSICAPAGR